MEWLICERHWQTSLFADLCVHCNAAAPVRKATEMLQQTRPHFSLSHVTGLEEPADYIAFNKTLNLLFHRPLSPPPHALTPAVPLNTLTWRKSPHSLETERRPTNAEGNAEDILPNRKPFVLQPDTPTSFSWQMETCHLQLCISASCRISSKSLWWVSSHEAT